jgi:hypothetical protein
MVLVVPVVKGTLLALLAAAALTACGDDEPDTPAGQGTAGQAPMTANQSGQSGQSGSPGAGGSASRRAVATSASPGWTVTVYYTAVLGFHTERAVKVTGCPKLDCTRGHDDLGSYPADFVEAVKDEGAGRIAAGKYLNWSSDTGYWLDTAPRDTAGRALRPFVSAAADSDVMRAGTAFDIVQCGHDEGGDAVDPAVCAKLKSAAWEITDEFTPGLGGSHHVDVYIGEETGTDFTDSDWYTTLENASLAIAR